MVWLGPEGQHVAHLLLPLLADAITTEQPAGFTALLLLRALSRLRPFNHPQSFRFLQQPNTPSAFYGFSSALSSNSYTSSHHVQRHFLTAKSTLFLFTRRFL